MQQIQPDSPGRLPVSAAVPAGAARHDGLILIGMGGETILHARLLAPVVHRLLSPGALIEGIDRRLNDPWLHAAARRARAAIMLLPPLGNQCNPLYSVHPRRNDRFLAARAPLRALFPEVDFTEFDFTGHMLGALAATCPERFAHARQALQQAWLEKLAALMAHMPDRGVLLHHHGPAWLPLPPIAGAAGTWPVLHVDCADADDATRRIRAALGPALRGLLA
ncbi:MAG: hypothetical protein HLUCCA12_04730 [Rhodobacteraceae bacterium HLUCCA12]|nr:MAG: hypothetical protein HLUCCA12_04730 [Rhodobacteraceae bacterium HLUCCA12]